MIKRFLAVPLLCVGLGFNSALAQTLVNVETTKGKFVLALDEEKAPQTVENFLTYVDKKFYEGLVFHRVISGFMVQAGGMTPDMEPRVTLAPIKNEANNGLKNLRGTIAMARTSDPHSATSQFFINTVDNDFLNYSAGNPGYAVFGKVVEGMDVVDAIESVSTTFRNGYKDVPNEPILINSISRSEP